MQSTHRPGLPRAACVGERAGGYSVLLNSAMATPSRTRPITATMASDSQIGTSQPFQVIPGDRWAKATGLMLRCENTACRIGPTTYVSGSILVSTLSQPGSPDSGYSAPDR